MYPPVSTASASYQHCWAKTDRSNTTTCTGKLPANRAGRQFAKETGKPTFNKSAIRHERRLSSTIFSRTSPKNTTFPRQALKFLARCDSFWLRHGPSRKAIARSWSLPPKRNPRRKNRRIRTNHAPGLCATRTKVSIVSGVTATEGDGSRTKSWLAPACLRRQLGRVCPP